VNSVKIKEESVNLLAGEEVLSGRCVLCSGNELGLAVDCFLGFSECEMSASDAVDGSSTGT
jgi:hypothetical protein